MGRQFKHMDGIVTLFYVIFRGRITTVDRLVLTSLDQLKFTLKILFNFVTKQATLTRKPTALSLPFQLVFPVRFNVSR
jgi:hypothetical protein